MDLDGPGGPPAPSRGSRAFLQGCLRSSSSHLGWVERGVGGLGEASFYDCVGGAADMLDPLQTCCLPRVSRNDAMTLEHQLLSWSLMKPWVLAPGLASSRTPGVGEVIKSAVVMMVLCTE